MKRVKNDYEQQVQQLRKQTKQYLVNNPKLNPKVEEYLKQIQELERKNGDLVMKIKDFEKDKITHDCLKHALVINRQNDLKKEKDALTKKKKQYDQALASIQTSVEDLLHKKALIHQQPTQTDFFVTQQKISKQNKDHMIDEIYGRMKVMDKRISTIS